MAGWNLPDGCRVSDLPGWNDEDGEVEMTCQSPTCDHTWSEYVSADSDGPVDADEPCEKCGSAGAGEVTWFADRADAYADAMADRAERESYYD